MAACSRPGARRGESPRFTRQWSRSAPIGTSLQKCDGWGKQWPALGFGGEPCGAGPGPNRARLRDPAGLGSSGARQGLVRNPSSVLAKQRQVALRVQLLPPRCLCLLCLPCLPQAAALPCSVPTSCFPASSRTSMLTSTPRSHSLIHQLLSSIFFLTLEPGEVASPDSASAMHRA